MPDLSFEILSANPAIDVVTPAIGFDLRIANGVRAERIQTVLLRCQILIEVARRRYSTQEQQQLRDLFDDPSRWGDTLRPITWTNLSLNIAAFSETTNYSMIVPCSFDFSVATAKYFHAIEQGDVPLTFLFSGSVFYAGSDGLLQVAPISWNKEARFRLPVETWNSVMELHYPNAVCVYLRRDVFDQLYRFKTSLGVPTFEEAIQQMLAIAERERPVS